MARCNYQSILFPNYHYNYFKCLRFHFNIKQNCICHDTFNKTEYFKMTLQSSNYEFFMALGMI